MTSPGDEKDLKIALEEIEKMIKEGKIKKKDPNLKDKEGDPNGRYDTGVVCVIPNCSGKIVRDVSRKYRGSLGDIIVGPGSKNQMSKVVKLFCEKCGIMYNHLPGS